MSGSQTSPAPIASRTKWSVALVLLAGLAGGAAGCGGDAAESEVQGVGPVRAGSVAALAECRDWNAGTVEEKLATIEDIRGQVHPEEGTVKTPPLTDEQAYDLFEQACKESYAASLQLYRLYVQRAAVQPLAP